MPNENDGDAPSSDSKRQAPSQSPMTPSTPQQDEMRDDANNRSDSKEEKAIKIEEDIRSGERWLIGISAAGVILNVVIASIYYGQLKEMRKATIASEGAANAAASAADTAVKTLNEIRAGGVDTHDLATQAKRQSGLAADTLRFNRSFSRNEQRPFLAPIPSRMLKKVLLIHN